MALRRRRTYASSVTEEQTVEGGLAEPEELEPDQGSLDLALPEDRRDRAQGRAEWEAAAAAVLRKAGRLADEDADELVWDRLTRQTLDGIGITPLGTPELLDELVTVGRPTRPGEWDIRAHLAVTDARTDNQTLLTDLEGGVTSLWLEVDEDVDWSVLLDQVLLELAPVVLQTTEAGARAFLQYAGDRELHPRSNLGLDVRLASRDLADQAWQMGVRVFVVDATEVHDRGASDVQELAHSLAIGAHYLRRLTDDGFDLDEAAKIVEFRYAATDEQFTTIAKLRAARRLWGRVLELSGTSVREQHQHAVTSRPMMSKYDPWVNLLRTTVAAFAAGVGGADAVTVLPFDSPLGIPDGFGRRIARNTSALLISESHVAAVADPAGGAYAVEKLTDDLAVAAWDLFGRLEEGADLLAEIAVTVEQRDREVATRRRPLTGLTEFPNLAEQLPERVPAPEGREVRRYGTAFEALRDDPPGRHVFLATMGVVAAHTARATFAANLLAAGGIAVDVAGATESVDDLVAAYDGQRVVCLAGTDGAYDSWADEAAAALREAGAGWLVIAGKPRDGVDDSATTGVDALEFLHRTREKLE
jgi:methylmalonyl-CoA mutase